jgi:metal-responsive CopG/Arc/MetJ family transcriptional regulator
MKTIAISIDEPTLKRIDRLMENGATQAKGRSEIFRQAVTKFIDEIERAAEEDREREIFRRHRSQLNHQAAALIEEQANR